MDIIYLAAIYPEKYNLYSSSSTIVSPAYKFNKTFAEAFSIKEGFSVCSYIPYVLRDRITEEEYNSFIIENNVKYIYLDKSSYKSYRNFVSAMKKDINKRFKNKKSFIICDALSKSLVFVSLTLSKFARIRNCFIVTDFPQFVGDLKKTFIQRLKNKVFFHFMKKGDTFVFLTEQMCHVMNRNRKKKYTVIEGFCKKDEACYELSFENKYEKKTCLYAGSLHKEYGIDLLIKAFINCNFSDCELHIYGSGNYLTEIQQLCNLHSNVKYMGIVPNSVIVEEERKVTLLINPRYSNEEFTKYSFPSKTLEYMASGTPVLMNKLAGLPMEYNSFLYFFNEETLEGYEDGLKKVLSNDERTLFDFGMASKIFVLNNKTAEIQVDKFIADIF